MQLVEQRFELVIGDQVAARDRSTVGGVRHWCRGHSHVEGINLERTLAMQLIEQGFELVIGNIAAFRRRVRCRCGARRDGGLGSNNRWGELPLAVQLIEQRLELGIGDLVATCLGSTRGRRHGHLRLFLDRIE